MGRRIPGGYQQTADLCEAERDVNEAMSLMQGIVNTVKLPAEALVLMLKVTFILVHALSAIHRARAVTKNTSSEEE